MLDKTTKPLGQIWSVIWQSIIWLPSIWLNCPMSNHGRVESNHSPIRDRGENFFGKMADGRMDGRTDRVTRPLLPSFDHNSEKEDLTMKVISSRTDRVALVRLTWLMAAFFGITGRRTFPEISPTAEQISRDERCREFRRFLFAIISWELFMACHSQCARRKFL